MIKFLLAKSSFYCFLIWHFSLKNEKLYLIPKSQVHNSLPQQRRSMIVELTRRCESSSSATTALSSVVLLQRERERDGNRLAAQDGRCPRVRPSSSPLAPRSCKMAVPHVAVRAEFKRAARGYVRRAVDSMNARCSPWGSCRCAGGLGDVAQHRVADADAPVEMMTLLNTAWQVPMRRWRR